MKSDLQIIIRGGGVYSFGIKLVESLSGQLTTLPAIWETVGWHARFNNNVITIWSLGFCAEKLIRSLLWKGNNTTTINKFRTTCCVHVPYVNSTLCGQVGYSATYFREANSYLGSTINFYLPNIILSLVRFLLFISVYICSVPALSPEQNYLIAYLNSLILFTPNLHVIVISAFRFNLSWNYLNSILHIILCSFPKNCSLFSWTSLNAKVNVYYAVSSLQLLRCAQIKFRFRTDNLGGLNLGTNQLELHPS